MSGSIFGIRLKAGKSMKHPVETVPIFRLIDEKRLAFLWCSLYNSICFPYIPAGVMELVDVVDSKSPPGDSVPVRVRPPAPNQKGIQKGCPFILDFAA